MSKVLTNLIFKSSTPILDETEDFPSAPEFGQFCFKGGILYIYASVENAETWYPLTNKNQYYIHRQAISADSWVVGHGLKTEDIIFMVYDENNTQIIPSGVTFDSENQITLLFTTPIRGRCVVFGASESFSPTVHTSEILVGDNISISGTSIVVSGIDIVALLDQTHSNLTSMFSWDENLGQITFKGDLIPIDNSSLSIGSETKKIKDLYLSAETLHVGDNATFEGTSLSIDAGSNPTSLSAVPTIQVSSLVLRPFTYNPGGGAVTVNPTLQFKNAGGEQYGISFNLSQNEFSLDTPQGVGSGKLKTTELVVLNKIIANTIETTGTEQIKFDQSVRIDGDVTLGYDQNNDVTIRGNVNLQTPIIFSQAATLGDGNDTITVNCGLANKFTVQSQNISVNADGKLTIQEIESNGDVTIQGDLFVNGTQTIVNTNTLEVQDNEVIINNGEIGPGITAGTAGIRIDRGSLPDSVLLFNEVTDKWQMGIAGSVNDIAVTGHIHDDRYLRSNATSEPSEDNVHSLGATNKKFANIYATTFNGALNGLALQASSLETSRSIYLSGDVTGSALFNGTGDANISATIVDDSHTHDGRYFTETEQDSRFLRRNANSAPSEDISYDLGSPLYRWNNIYATSFKGTADNADKLTNARSIALTGDVTGSASFDGSQNVSITASVADDSHAHDTRYFTETEADSLFVKTAGGSVMAGGLRFNNSIVCAFGTASNMGVYHNGNDGVMYNGTGATHFQVASKTAMVLYPNSAVYLYYDNTWRLRTHASGVEVNGTMYGTASTALYADLAENLTCAKNDLPAGTIMKACEVGSFEVEECDTECAKNVIGVVSENPAYLMNSGVKGIPVAYTGKVRVRVLGPISKGCPIISAGNGVSRGIYKDSELLYSFGTTLEEHTTNKEALLWCAIK